MRCKKHLSDYSSAIGVCATCLRQRLYAIVEAQSKPNSISDNPNPNPNPNHSLSSGGRYHHQQQKQNQEQPPPLIFPRSVSPYIARRKSDQTTSSSSNKPIIQRFYSTPQAGPTEGQKKKSGKFGLLTKLFRSKSSVVEVGGVGSTRRRNRGMSPQSEWEEEDVSAVGPAELTRPSPGRTRPSHVSSLALCLSPLVRASPASRYNWGMEPTFSGEIRVPASGGISQINNNNSSKKEKPQLGDAASYCANRSRKIADFGRFNRKR